jgi:putative membrane protein
MLAAILSALHVLTLGLGLGAIFARVRALRAVAGGDAAAVGRVLSADSLWGLAAAAWIVTGLARLFGGVEKTTDFYLHNGFFWMKMALFASVFALEIAPMIAFIRWRSARARGVSISTAHASLYARISLVELSIVIVITFVAAAMSRGLWLLS